MVGGKKRSRLRWGAAGLGLVVLVIVAAARAEPDGPAEVIDGRTLKVGGETVRLYGIDAPDIGQVCRSAKGRPFNCGDRARLALMDLLVATTVRCTPRGRDEAGRIVAQCHGAGFDLSLNMVHTGWALADRTVTDRYAGIEDKARAAGRGLWRGTFERPEEWRRHRQD